DSINTLSPQANLYVESGQYTQLSLENNLTLNQGQALFGRDNDFTAAASSSELPELMGSLTLTGDNYISRIEMLNDGDQTVGVTLNDNAQNVVLDHVTIGSEDVSAGAYQTGVQLGNNNSLLIENSLINAFSSQSTGDLVVGVKMDGVSGD